MKKTLKTNLIFVLIQACTLLLLSTNCAAPKGGSESESEVPAEENLSYLNFSVSDVKRRSGEMVTEQEEHDGFSTESRAATYADTFNFSVTCGNDSTCFSPVPSPALSSGTATPKCYNLSSYASSVANNTTIPLITTDNGTVKLFCRIKLNSFNYKNSGQNYLPASSNLTIDMDFRNAVPGTTSYATAGNGVQYNDSNGSTPGPNLYGFYKYTNTSGSSHTAVGTLNLLFSTTNSPTGTTTGTAASATGTSVANTIQSATVIAPTITSLTYQAIPAVGNMAKQYTVYFTSSADVAGAADLTSSDSCRIFYSNSTMTTVYIGGSLVTIPTDITTAQNLFLDANGNMLPYANSTYDYVDCKTNSFTAANSGNFWGVLNNWGTSLTTPISGSTTAVTLSSTTKSRIVVFASDATDTSSGAAKKASRAFAIFKIPVTTSSTTAW